MEIDYIDFARDLIIDLVSMYVFVFLLYYRRHGDRDMAVTLGLFNLFLFTIVITMTLTEFNLAAGFALFALLSIISLRSVNIAKVEVGYLFGALTLGLVNGISLHDYLMLALCNLTIIGGAWVLDCKWLLKPTVEVEMTLEEVSATDLKDRDRLRERVQDLHELPVAHVEVQKYNAAKGTARLGVRLRLG